MRIDFKPKNQEEVLSVLLFYWAYWWRALLGYLLICVPIGALYFALLSTASTAALVCTILLTLPLIIFLGAAVTLYLFRKLAFIEFKTFSVKWIIPEPQSIFERVYLTKVLIYLGTSVLSGLIFSVPFSFSVIFQAFLFYLFVKNQWLPLTIEAKTETA